MTVTNISRFRELIFSDFALTSKLFAITEKERFIAAVIDIASDNGILLSESNVNDEINAGTRSWLERWI